MPSVLELLLQSAQRDVDYTLWWYNESRDADWLRLHVSACRQRDDFAAALVREEAHA